ncbi:MAG: hypothetical protein GWP06_12025 [Actinobacteria bacterium]|nr:hypothetical protein [Actinomycetota bacterium]
MNPTRFSRRSFLSRAVKSSAAVGLLGAFDCHPRQSNGAAVRHFHLSTSIPPINNFPDLIPLARQAGVTDVWLGSFLYGRWFSTPKELRAAADRLEKQGLAVHIINVPLGHPGNALGVGEEAISSTPPRHWQNACTVDGKLYSGTSIHPPAVKENVRAMQALQAQRFDAVFLDDDFRVARYPGIIGGCFCDDCRDDFLKTHGYKKVEWEALIDSVHKRHPSAVLRAWVDYWCDKLWGMFTTLQSAAPKITLGNMIMYLGAEKAGIPLDKFRDVPFRVGELMFNDKSFDRLKGKTDELFSALFHRRFAKAELAYSETTAFPADQLSAKNMAAKLTISLIADVRNSMFMSGLKPFPLSHWDLLGPAMRKSARLHEKLAGHKPSGPFKHFWGWDSRLVGRDQPFSLFLASGIPFEVVEDIPADGWVFLSDKDARGVAEGRIAAKSQNLPVRRKASVSGKYFLPMEENLKDVFALKNRIIPELKDTPYVRGENPAVFAWYPTARAALLWNVDEEKLKQADNF